VVNVGNNGDVTDVLVHVHGGVLSLGKRKNVQSGWSERKAEGAG